MNKERSTSLSPLCGLSFIYYCYYTRVFPGTRTLRIPTCVDKDYPTTRLRWDSLCDTLLPRSTRRTSLVVDPLSFDTHL